MTRLVEENGTRVNKPWRKSDKKTGSAGLTRENFHYKLSSVSTTETSDFTLFLFSVRFSLTLSFGLEQTWVIDIRAGSFNQQGSFPVSPVLFTGSSQTLSGGKSTLLPLLSASLTDRSGVRERAVDDPDGLIEKDFQLTQSDGTRKYGWDFLDAELWI